MCSVLPSVREQCLFHTSRVPNSILLHGGMAHRYVVGGRGSTFPTESSFASAAEPNEINGKATIVSVPNAIGRLVCEEFIPSADVPRFLRSN